MLSNAIKFSPDGGSIYLSAGRINEVPNQRRDDLEDETIDYIEISVKDSGIGLKSDDLDHIFESFEQVENSASRTYQGTGLGLSLTKRLVELHKGRIWAESKGENNRCFLYVHNAGEPENTLIRRLYPNVA